MPDCTSASNHRNLFPEFNSGLFSSPAIISPWVNPLTTKARGRRAGWKVKEREICQKNVIKSVVTPREQEWSSRQSGVNKNNLIQIQLQPQHKLEEQALSMALVNCRSLNKNGFKLKDHAVEYDCDIIAVTETWLPNEETLANQIIGDTCPKGYKMSQNPRNNGQRGGGVGIMYKSCLDVRAISDDGMVFESFEYIMHLVKVGLKLIRIVTIYRPPPSSTNGLTMSKFTAEFTMFLEHLLLLPGQIVILGDFNFHIDDSSNVHASEFLELLDVFNLTQHVDKPTHKHGHILDLIITDQGEDLIKDIQVYIPWISDHSLVSFNLTVPKPVSSRKTVVSRNWKSVDVEKFKEDVGNAEFSVDSDLVSESVHQYDRILHALTEKYAPLRKKNISIRPRAQWFTTELSEEKRKKRRLERRYRRTGAPKDIQAFNEQCVYYCQLLSTTRQSFYINKIQENTGDQRVLFFVVDKLLHRKTEPQLPVHENLNELTNRFADFFVEKIRKIRSSFGTTSCIEPDVPEMNCKMTEFSPVSSKELETIIKKSNNKYCSLDPIPTWLLKECLPSLLSWITNIVNQSLSSVMPTAYKEAILTPILKKTNLDTEQLKNYRPISNLSYVSKLIEKVVAKQITSYMSTNWLDETMQSAYRTNHSTETALIRIHNDILWALDRNEAVLFISLDLSAAFDTIDHKILLARLEHRLGITGNCLKWICSYLEDRKLRVAIDGEMSELKDLSFGVPQGSVLGPKLFTMYILPLGDIARKHNIHFHMYADDCQLYITFLKVNSSMVKTKMELLLTEIREWMAANMLKLNDDKTEIIAFDGPRRNPVQLSPLRIGNEVISISDSVRILGVDLDNNMTLKGHIHNVAKACFFKLKNMFKIRKCIDESAAKAMVHTMITSKLDYCNAILYGLPESSLKCLSSVQKTSARLITQSGKYDHITPIMKKLHWLPIRKRIDYKVLVMVHKTLNGLSPVYLDDLIQRRPNKGTRADSNGDLVVPGIKRSTFGGRTFGHAGSSLWNSLPRQLKTINDTKCFKKELKTFLFKSIYIS